MILKVLCFWLQIILNNIFNRQFSTFESEDYGNCFTLHLESDYEISEPGREAG